MIKNRNYWVGFAIISMFLVVAVYFWHARYVPGKVTFQEYTPSYLPEGVSVKHIWLQAIYVPSHKPYTQLTLQLSTGYIYEQKYDGKNFSYTCHWPPDDSTCDGKVSNGRNKYIIRTIKDAQGKLSYLLDWTRGNTWLTVSLDSDQNGFDDEVLGRIVDSFQLTIFKGLNVGKVDRSVI